MLEFYQFLSLASLALQVLRDCKTDFKSRLAQDARLLNNPNYGNQRCYIFKHTSIKTIYLSKKNRLVTLHYVIIVYIMSIFKPISLKSIY